MRSRLSNNPHDVQANAYFSEKIRKENVQHQYEQMMEEYPEATGPVFFMGQDPKRVHLMQGSWKDCMKTVGEVKYPSFISDTVKSVLFVQRMIQQLL